MAGNLFWSRIEMCGIRHRVVMLPPFQRATSVKSKNVSPFRAELADSYQQSIGFIPGTS